MAWDEWEQLKADAAGRAGGARTQIDHLDEPDAGGATSGVTKGLKSNQAAWNKAGEGVGGLREKIGASLTKLADGQKGLGDDAGCLTTGAQQDVYDSWARYVKAVDERCGSVKEILERIGHDLLLTDDAVRTAFAGVDAEYADTPALGGQDAGR
jgi:hypothetical protein